MLQESIHSDCSQCVMAQSLLMRQLRQPLRQLLSHGQRSRNVVKLSHMSHMLPATAVLAGMGLLPKLPKPGDQHFQSAESAASAAIQHKT
jgi:hypothetical protein